MSDKEGNGLKNEIQEWQNAALEGFKLWNRGAVAAHAGYELMKDCNQILDKKRKLIEEQCQKAGIKEEKMTTNEAGKETKDEAQITPCCGNCQEFLAKPREPTGLCQSPHVVAGITVCTFMAADNCCNDWKAKEIDELITRHQATLDLLAAGPAVYPKTEPFLRATLGAEAVKKIVDRVTKKMAENIYRFPRMTQEEIESEPKPAPEPEQRAPILNVNDLPKDSGVGFFNKPEPAECGCIDKAKLLDQLKFYVKTCNAEIASALEEEDFVKAARYKTALEGHQHLEGMILRGKLDRAACKPEPAPEPIPAGELGIVTDLNPGDIVTTRILPGGEIRSYRCRGQKGVPAPSKPALDKEDLLKTIRAWADEPLTDPVERKAYGLVSCLIEHGSYDLPATDLSTCDGGPVRECDCSTANLVELLRSRASVADGIDITELNPDQLLTLRCNKSAIVIAVRKEGN